MTHPHTEPDRPELSNRAYREFIYEAALKIGEWEDSDESAVELAHSLFVFYEGRLCKSRRE